MRPTPQPAPREPRASRVNAGLRPLSFAGWPSGMDNIHADHEIGADTLRRAVNADVLDSGKIR